MSNLLMQLRVVASELRRRKVFRVLLAYLVAAAAIIGVVADVEGALELPRHTLTVVVVLLVAGLPVAALIAWMYELVPDRGGESGATGDPEPAAAGAVLSRADEAAGPGQAGRAAVDEVRGAALLPAQATPFVGREAELDGLVRLATGDARLVSVTGSGGVGKTRLALQAARRVALQLADGAVFVPLAGVTDPNLLPQAIADALDLSLSRREDPLAEVLDYLRGKQILLLLDDFEPLVSAAGVVESLIGVPGVRVLVTSRERLHLPAESLFPLGGLAVAAGAGEESEALQLFVAAARRQDPDFALEPGTQECARRLCELLAGVPLAIELAAAWTRILTCGEILEEVRRDIDILSADSPVVPERRRSLRATFDASWRLLGDRERASLARLAVFAAPFGRDVAGDVAGADLPILRALVDKSFLTPEGGRFHMLHVIRQYALRRLEEDPGEALQTRTAHVRWFTAWLRSLEPQLMRAEPEAVSAVVQVMADVRAAWAFACEQRDVDALFDGMNALFHFYDARGWSREGARAFEQAQRAIEGFSPADDRSARAGGMLAVRRGALLERLGDIKEADRSLRDGLASAERIRDDREIAFTLHRLGRVCSAAGAYDEAARLHVRARHLCERLGDRHGTAWSMAYLGNIALNRGEHDLAAQLYTDSLEILRTEHDRNGMSATLNNLGYIAIRNGRYDEARQKLGEALALQAGLGNRRAAAYLLNNLGYAAREAGDFAEAAQHFEEAQSISERMGYRGIIAAALTGRAALFVRTGELDAAMPLLHTALEIARELGDHRVALEALLTLARLRVARGDESGVELARYVAQHPATPADTRVEAAELLGGNTAQPVGSRGDAAAPDDLDRVIGAVLPGDGVAEAEPAATTIPYAAGRRVRTHSQGG